MYCPRTLASFNSSKGIPEITSLSSLDCCSIWGEALGKGFIYLPHSSSSSEPEASTNTPLSVNPLNDIPTTNLQQSNVSYMWRWWASNVQQEQRKNLHGFIGYYYGIGIVFIGMEVSRSNCERVKSTECTWRGKGMFEENHVLCFRLIKQKHGTFITWCR